MELRSAIITFLSAEFLFKVAVKVYKTFTGSLKIQTIIFSMLHLQLLPILLFSILYLNVFPKRMDFQNDS